MKHENSSDNETFFLNLDIESLNKIFSIIFNDKRNSFPFSVVNIPSRLFYCSLKPEFVRIARTTTKLENFKSSFAKMIYRTM